MTDPFTEGPSPPWFVGTDWPQILVQTIYFPVLWHYLPRHGEKMHFTFLGPPETPLFERMTCEPPQEVHEFFAPLTQSIMRLVTLLVNDDLPRAIPTVVSLLEHLAHASGAPPLPKAPLMLASASLFRAVGERPTRKSQSIWQADSYLCQAQLRGRSHPLGVVRVVLGETYSYYNVLPAAPTNQDVESLIAEVVIRERRVPGTIELPFTPSSLLVNLAKWNDVALQTLSIPAATKRLKRSVYETIDQVSQAIAVLEEEEFILVEPSPVQLSQLIAGIRQQWYRLWSMSRVKITHPGNIWWHGYRYTSWRTELFCWLEGETVEVYRVPMTDAVVVVNWRGEMLDLGVRERVKLPPSLASQLEKDRELPLSRSRWAEHCVTDKET